MKPETKTKNRPTEQGSKAAYFRLALRSLEQAIRARKRDDRTEMRQQALLWKQYTNAIGEFFFYSSLIEPSAWRGGLNFEKPEIW